MIHVVKHISRKIVLLLVSNISVQFINNCDKKKSFHKNNNWTLWKLPRCNYTSNYKNLPVLSSPPNTLDGGLFSRNLFPFPTNYFIYSFFTIVNKLYAYIPNQQYMILRLYMFNYLYHMRLKKKYLFVDKNFLTRNKMTYLSGTCNWPGWEHVIDLRTHNWTG